MDEYNIGKEDNFFIDDIKKKNKQIIIERQRHYRSFLEEFKHLVVNPIRFKYDAFNFVPYESTYNI